MEKLVFQENVKNVYKNKKKIFFWNYKNFDNMQKNDSKWEIIRRSIFLMKNYVLGNVKYL